MNKTRITFTNGKIFFACLKKELHSLLIQPFTYIAALIFSISTNCNFFFFHNFFVDGQGTTSLRSFFEFIPYISILIIPVITMAMWDKEDDVYYSYPVSSLIQVLSKQIAAFCLFFCFLLFCIPVPIIVSFFGSIDIAQILCSFLGIILFSLCAISFTVCISFFTKNQTIAFCISALSLAIVNLIHLLPSVFSLQGFLSSICKIFSFAWHFDSSAKGIIDTKDIVFYLVIYCLFLFLNLYLLEYKKKKNNQYKFTFFLAVVSLVLFFFCGQRFFIRSDRTNTRQFSLSEITLETIKTISEPLQITYYVSPKLKNIYPDVDDVSDYLSLFSSNNKNIKYTEVNPDSDVDLQSILASQGIMTQQTQTVDNNQVVYTNVYSGIIIEYMEKNSVIPFVLSTATLEYDMVNRIEYLVNDISRVVQLLVGNDLSIDDYEYVTAWFEASGFTCIEYNLNNLETLSKDFPLVIFGCSNIDSYNTSIIEDKIMQGMPSLFLVSKNSININSDWAANPPVNNPPVLDMLNYWGLKISDSIVLDISNYRIAMQMTETETANTQYINYPFWIVTLPQNVNYNQIINQTYSGAEFFWPSYIETYPTDTTKITPLIYTTNKAWYMNKDNSKEQPFITDPFYTEYFNEGKTTQGQFCLAAILEGQINGYYSVGKKLDSKIMVLADQYFASNILTYSNSSYNLDYLVSSVLYLTNNENLLSIKNKATPITTLYKIESSEQMNDYKSIVLIILFVIIPVIILTCFILVILIRKKRNA